MNSYVTIVLVSISVYLVGCDDSSEKVKLPEIDTSGSPNGIVPIPEYAPEIVKEVFVKYTKCVAPNGKPIQFLAQDGWTDEQILHARDVLQHILTDFPGSKYGNDKSVVANSMADKRATMVLFNNVGTMEEAFDKGLRKLNLSMQDLRSNESPGVGDQDYMNHITRDAAYEEVWHLIHDYGIVPTLLEMTAEMRIANDEAALNGWDAWPKDEPQEHPNEYVGALIDNYYDLWVVTPTLYEARDYKSGPEGTSHSGNYFANSRQQQKVKDTLGYALLQKFFQPYLTYAPRLPADFEGTFSVAFDSAMAYTYKTRHLVDVTLTGSNPVTLLGNDFDNLFTGNKGNNTFQGAGGNDQLLGMEGVDTVKYVGIQSDYEIKINGDVLTVTDKLGSRDGEDELHDIEFLLFEDRVVAAETLKK